MESTIEINLFRDFAEVYADFLELRGFDRPDLSNPNEVLIKGLSFEHRLIPMTPRTIHKPAGFVCPPQYLDALAFLETKIVNGDDLVPHQSRKIINSYYKDRLLSDWGIQHLHLGTEMESSRPLIQGTSEVLFVYFKGVDAYFITIAAHDTWTDQDMIRILHDNFPSAIESWRIKGIIGLTHVPSDSEVKAMRKAGINSGLEIYPGIVYMGTGGGIASDGSSIVVSMGVINYVHISRNMERTIKESETSIRDRIRRSGQSVPEILKFKLMRNNNEYVITETNTNIEFYKGAI